MVPIRMRIFLPSCPPKCENRFSRMTPTATSEITPDLIREHGLTPEECEKVKQLLGGREPTLTELGIFSVMWSEHCSQSSVVRRAVPGGSYGSGWHSARHLHHGRTAGSSHGLSAIWVDYSFISGRGRPLPTSRNSQESFHSRRCSQRYRFLWQLLRRTESRRRNQV
jgi:Formylglycinamide ribonucleotide amidotransferase linker domain